MIAFARTRKTKEDSASIEKKERRKIMIRGCVTPNGTAKPVSSSGGAGVKICINSARAKVLLCSSGSQKKKLGGSGRGESQIFRQNLAGKKKRKRRKTQITRYGAAQRRQREWTLKTD